MKRNPITGDHVAAPVYTGQTIGHRVSLASSGITPSASSPMSWKAVAGVAGRISDRRGEAAILMCRDLSMPERTVPPHAYKQAMEMSQLGRGAFTSWVDDCSQCIDKCSRTSLLGGVDCCCAAFSAFFQSAGYRTTSSGQSATGGWPGCGGRRGERIHPISVAMKPESYGGNMGQLRRVTRRSQLQVGLDHAMGAAGACCASSRTGRSISLERGQLVSVSAAAVRPSRPGIAGAATIYRAYGGE